MGALTHLLLQARVVRAVLVGLVDLLVRPHQTQQFLAVAVAVGPQVLVFKEIHLLLIKVLGPGLAQFLNFYF